jgi:hypothetical protein
VSICQQGAPCGFDALAVAHDAQPRFGHGHNLAPQPLHHLAVQARRAGKQAAGVYHVRRADGMHIRNGVRQPLQQPAQRARMV